MTDAALSPEEQLIEDIASFTHDPLGYALYAFPWGEEGTELAHASGPRKW
ncbi:terminase, partial [Klebsiella pneumoniae]|nr:terminase [Klebsiella pneumoniae]